jgi:hypothetical protein
MITMMTIDKEEMEEVDVIWWSMDDDIGTDECRWVIECDCWCGTDDDVDDRWMMILTQSLIHPMVDRLAVSIS